MKIELDLNDYQLGLLKYSLVMLDIKCDEKLYFLNSEIEHCKNETKFEILKQRISQSEKCKKNIEIVLDQLDKINII